MKATIKFAASAVAAALVLGAGTAAYAATMCGYSFSGWHSGGSLPSTKYSSTWTSNSTNNTVLIKGWQDTGTTSIVANLDYAVVEDDIIGWGDHWVHQPVKANFTQAGTWYSKTFTGIPNGIDIAIMQTIINGNSTDGGGNAYQS